ncbi:MAG: sulfur carrier protein ThiS [Deltaproteobacteria bacterium]|nr:sulfur carrier protein ThiS [Deltaproteobacteria bacterium]
MELMVNGKMLETTANISVVELLNQKNVESPDMVSVEINGRILSREKFNLTKLQEKDQVEFLYFMGGG